MDVDSEKGFLYTKVNTNFRSLDAVLGASSDADVLDILQVVIWKNASILQGPPTTLAGTMSVVSKAVKSALSAPKLTWAFWSEIETDELLKKSGKYADAFISEFEDLCRDIPADVKTNLFELRVKLCGKPLPLSKIAAVTTVAADPPEPVGPIRESLTVLLDMIKQDVDIGQCINFYRQTVFPKIVAEVDRLSGRYDCQLANCVPAELADIDDAAYQDLFNHLVREMNGFLESKNIEIGCQHQNFKRMCTLVKTTQTKVFDLLEAGGFNRVDLLNFASRTMETLQHIESCSKSEVTVAICGETSTGKTTLIGGIVGALCFPTSDAANTACPMRICVQAGSTYRTLRIPVPLLQALESAFEAIRQALDLMKQKKIPTDIPLSVHAEEARDVYDLALNASGPMRLFESFLGSEAVDNDFQIRESISRINGLVRLIYNLKGAARFETRLSNIHPLSVLLEAPNILAVLPTVTASCLCVEAMPFVGGINFIDTPGVSEHADKGTFMFHMKLVVRRIFERTNRTIILTTPTTLSNSAFKALRKLVQEVVDGTDRLMIAVNKFDTLEAGTDLQRALASYRMMFAKEGCSLTNVQILQAKILRDITFGLKELASVGGLAYLKQNRDAPLGAPAQSLLETLYGSKFRRHINKYDDDDVAEDCKDLARHSNFENIVRIALQPAFLNAMEIEPASCLVHEAASLTSLITSLNARLAGIMKKAAAKELLQGSIKKIEKFMTTVPGIGHEIEEKLLNEFKQKAKIGKEKLFRRLKEALMDCESAPNRAARRDDVVRDVQYDYEFAGEVMQIKFSTSVYFKNKADCHFENERVLKRVNEVLAGSEIEQSWEIARRTLVIGDKSVVVTHLIALKNSIQESLNAEILNDAGLLDVFDSIQKEILNCNLNSEISTKSSCVCSLYPASGSAIRERDDLMAVMLRFFGVTINGKQVFIPSYGFFAHIVPVVINKHYSDDKCKSEVDAGGMDLARVMTNLLHQLDNLRLRLQSLFDQLDHAMQQEDETKLRRDIRELNKYIHEHRILKEAIVLRSSEEDVAARSAISAADLEAWKGRMIAEGIKAEDLATLTPLQLIFHDCDDLLTFEEAKATLLVSCEDIATLMPLFGELHEGAEIALEHATKQFQKNLQPAGMTIDVLAALKWYTLPNCFFGVLNKALRDGDKEIIVALRKLIWLILVGMKKLLPSSKTTVFRGVKLNMANRFVVGQKIVWPSFTSTSTTMKVAGGIDFFGGSEPGSISYRTLFYITLTTGAARSLSQVSVLPEEEVLLPPNSTFEVIDISNLYEDGRLDVELREVESVDAVMHLFPELESEPASPTTTESSTTPASGSSSSNSSKMYHF
jgi:hypothetical protein